MKIYIVFAFMMIALKGGAQGPIEKDTRGIFLADPTIFVDNGTYYLYGTTGVSKPGGDGFLVYTSKDLEQWEGPIGKKKGWALMKGDAFGDQGFWAPQVFKKETTYYMAYTANEHIAIATSNSPLGPFINPSREEIKAPGKQIDPYVFFDDDGKKYLYHVRLTQGNRIFVAEMTDDFMGIIEETLVECIVGELPWENTAHSDWPVTEGPTVLKHKGLYYLIYSANDFRNPDYAVGYATSDTPFGPWKKSDKGPLIHKDFLNENGTGHGDVVVAENGELFYVMHTHYNGTLVQPRRTAILKFEFIDEGEHTGDLQIDTESFRFLLNKPSLE